MPTRRIGKRRPFIAFANARTTTLGTLLGKHSLTRWCLNLRSVSLRFSAYLCVLCVYGCSTQRSRRYAENRREKTESKTLLLTRRFSRPLCTVVRSQSRSQRRNLTFDFLSACNAHLVFYHVLIEVKERIFVAIDRATVVALEDRSFGQFHPVSNLY